MKRPELGVLGGSFDPPHMAHVMLALWGLSVGQLARVVVTPTYIHAFGKPLTPFVHRLRMCELAFAPLQCTDVLAIERELGGVSRTLRLVEALTAQYPEHQLRLLIGSDILAERARWQQFEQIAQLAPPLVAQRAGSQDAHPDANLGTPGLLPVLSSTAVREALYKTGRAPGLVPGAVADYITQHELYRSAPCT